MLAERRAQALAPLDTITADNAAPILRETAGRLQRIYETDVADPKFGASMPEADIAEFKVRAAAFAQRQTPDQTPLHWRPLNVFSPHEYAWRRWLFAQGTVTELWKGLAGVTDGDLQGASEEEGAQLIAFVRHLARLTDDLSNSGVLPVRGLVDVLVWYVSSSRSTQASRK